MIEVSAFFYENEYYLFPSCADNVSDLKAYIKNSGIVDLRASMLNSERCYPPCFTDNSVKESVIRDIDPRFIFPATVYMMSRGEYDEKPFVFEKPFLLLASYLLYKQLLQN